MQTCLAVHEHIQEKHAFPAWTSVTERLPQSLKNMMTTMPFMEVPYTLRSEELVSSDKELSLLKIILHCA